jgi:hypothetical protein
MRILVDYDNVPSTIRSQGPLYVADRLFECLRPELQKETRVDVRLYGGWYEEDKLTRRAQDLIVDLAVFPYPMWLKDQVPAKLVRINATLAQSLEILPKKHLHGTFRFRPAARRLSCGDLQQSGCTTNPCPLAPVPDFINNDACPQAGCAVTKTLLLRGTGEQKLVDSMLVADLVHLSRMEESMIAIVSSDDDVWPGIISALVAGVRVFHVRTGSGVSSIKYMDGVPGHYTEVTL